MNEEAGFAGDSAPWQYSDRLIAATSRLMKSCQMQPGYFLRNPTLSWMYFNQVGILSAQPCTV
jgi:hypothetical protein